MCLLFSAIMGDGMFYPKPLDKLVTLVCFSLELFELVGTQITGQLIPQPPDPYPVEPDTHLAEFEACLD